VHDEHTNCPCNGAKLCLTCHAWCHANPTRAMVEGFMVSRHVALPGDITVQSWYGPLLLRCDGDIEFDLTGADR
jgi:hypothetical protein